MAHGAPRQFVYVTDTARAATANLPAPPLVGAYLLGHMSVRDGAGSVPTAPAGWTLIGTHQCTNPDNWRGYTWISPPMTAALAAANAFAFSLTATGAGSFGLHVIELVGLSLVVDGTVQTASQQTAGTADTVSVTPSAGAPVQLWGFMDGRSDVSPTWSPSGAMIEYRDLDKSGGNGPRIGINYQLVAAAAGAYTVGSDLSSAGVQKGVTGFALREGGGAFLGEPGGSVW